MGKELYLQSQGSDVSLAAEFDDMDLGGWWFYFGMRIGCKDKEFIDELLTEIERLFFEVDEGSSDVIGKNGKKPKRVPVHRVRR